MPAGYVDRDDAFWRVAAEDTYGKQREYVIVNGIPMLAELDVRHFD